MAVKTMDDSGYSIKDIADSCSGSVTGDHSVLVSGVTTDSRNDVKGRLFVALNGKNFDGHDFCKSAVQNGAAAVLVSKFQKGLSVPQIAVKDTLEALTSFAAFHRAGFNGKVAAVTGSSGKTTTRTLLAAILSQKGSTLQPEKNFNNHIGVPLTVLKLKKEHDFAVFELGCSGFNEIAPLTGLVVPDVALITNVGPAHLENLKDLEGVAKAKGELFKNMPQRAVAVINIDDPYIAHMDVAAEKKVTFGWDAGADVQLCSRTPGLSGQIIELKTGGGIVRIEFPLPGEHNAIDAVAAAAAAFALNIEISDIINGLSGVKAPAGRLDITYKNGICIIDDTYNANPASMFAALDVLLEMVPAKHAVAVLGDMLELGDNSYDAHYKLGLEAGGAGLKALILKGEFNVHVAEGAIDAGMNAEDIYVAVSDDEIIEYIKTVKAAGDALLVKGSRGMKMDLIVERLKK
jgi:UDP-N-acetylmuramoyl-tripeptide--D-alanyl-D-alanine ligase